MSDIPDIWKQEKKKNGKLIFVHVPKCGGSYISAVLGDLNIINKGHNSATEQESRENTTFTVLRDPVDRLESRLNFHLTVNKCDLRLWPESLKNILKHPEISLDEIVSKFTDKELTMGKWYVAGGNESGTLYQDGGVGITDTYKLWIKNINIFMRVEFKTKMLSKLEVRYMDILKSETSMCEAVTNV